MFTVGQSSVYTTLIFFLALILSVGFHEFSHVLSAYLQGDQTGKMLGRLTLNPIKHLDLLGTIFMMLAAFTGFGIGWGKPAPFNPYNLRFRRWGSALVAIAGPISNIFLMALAGYILLFAGSGLPNGNLLGTFLAYLMIINASLALFNLLPITPLDGSHLLSAWLGPNNPLVVTLHRYGIYILVIMLVLGGNFLTWYITGGVHILLKILGLSSLA